MAERDGITVLAEAKAGPVRLHRMSTWPVASCAAMSPPPRVVESHGRLKIGELAEQTGCVHGTFDKGSWTSNRRNDGTLPGGSVPLSESLQQTRPSYWRTAAALTRQVERNTDRAE